MSSNQRLKDRCLELHWEMVDSVNPDYIIDHLLSKKVLIPDDYSNLREIKPLKERCRELLKLLYKTSHPEAFVHLRIALEKEYDWMVKKLDEQPTTTGEQLSASTQRLSIETPQAGVTEVIHSLADGTLVHGVTIIEHLLCIVRWDSSDVHLYDDETFILQRTIPVPGMTYKNDMASCKHYRCLYISNYTPNAYCIHRVELNGKVTRWELNDEPNGLSVTESHTVIVTFVEARKFVEFTTEGNSLREVTFQQDIAHPWHTIRLSADRFVVSHGERNDPLHRVCIVDANGGVVYSYGRRWGSGDGQLRRPYHIAVDRNGFVFVLDCNNCRILLLSPELKFVLQVVSRDQLKGSPFRIYLDGERLYVADNERNREGKWVAGRVTVHCLAP